MQRKLIREQFLLETLLVLTCIALVSLLYFMQGYKIVILNLFFLPVVLAGFFLGRYRAGILALLCVISSSMIVVLCMDEITGPTSPLIIALVLAVWGAVLGLSAIMVGTLSDDRTSKLEELHEAYVGVVEVLVQYLQSANPGLRAESTRVAELGREVAFEMNLSFRQIDDICVAALLHDVGNIEVTTRVIRKAVTNFEDDRCGGQSTFHGMDLMLSLGTVLRGAIPLLLKQPDLAGENDIGRDAGLTESPIGAQILAAVRDYVSLVQPPLGGARFTPVQAIQELRRDRANNYQATVLNALQRVITRRSHEARSPDREPVASLPPLPDASLTLEASRAGSEL
jgi:hypothetical protein